MFPPAMPKTMSMPASSSTRTITSAARVSVANSFLAVVIEPAPLYSLMRGKSGSGVTRATAAAPSCLRYPSPSPNGVSYSLSPSNLFRSGFPARKSPGHSGFSPVSIRR